MKVGVLGYFGYSNTGDEAILHCLLGELSQAAPDVETTVFSGDPLVTTSLHHVAAVPSLIPTHLDRLVVGILGRNRRNFFRCMNAFLSTDILIIGGGGLLFDTPATNRSLLALLTITKWAKRLGKKVVYLGIGIGPLHQRGSVESLRRVLSLVDLVSVRDSDSADLLNEHGIAHPNLQVAGDFVPLMKPIGSSEARSLLAEAGLRKRREHAVGICLNGERIGNEAINDAVTALSLKLLERGDTEVRFIPMQTAADIDDRLAAEDIIRRLPKSDDVKNVTTRLAPWRTMGIMREVLDAVVSVRLHGAVMAVGNGTPVLGVSYMPKVARLFKEIGRPDWQVPLDELTPERLIAGFSKVWDERAHVRSILEEVHPTMMIRSRLNVETFAKQFLGTRCPG